MSKTIALDFDGVLHSYTTKWQGPEIIPDPPVPGAVAFADNLIERGFKVYIFSTRCNTTKGRHAVLDWLGDHSFNPRILIAMEKVPADVYVDDRAYRFKGDFQETLNFIGEPGFSPKPWMKNGDLGVFE